MSKTVRSAFTGQTPGQYALKFNKPSRTKQSFMDECDINVIMAQYQQTGVIDFVTKHPPQFIDCTGADFDKAAYTVAAAQSLFNDLPSALRNRFENDPAQFLDFVHDESNKEEAQALGLLKPAAPAAAPAPATPEPTKPATAA
jgi:phage internal scaffolding protein